MEQKSQMDKDLNDIERISKQLVSLLSDRQPGLMSWLWAITGALKDMKEILDRVKVS